MIDLNNLKRSMLQGGLPSLIEGIRPDNGDAMNTFALLNDGTSVLVRAGAVPRPSWASTRRQLRRSTLMVGAPGLVERTSREQQLCADIEDALDVGGTVDGFLSLSRTLSGAVRALPYKGKAVTYKDVLTLARVLDREMAGLDALALLGLAPTTSKPAPAPSPASQKKAKKQQWVKIADGLAGLRR